MYFSFLLPLSSREKLAAHQHRSAIVLWPISSCHRLSCNFSVCVACLIFCDQYQHCWNFLLFLEMNRLYLKAEYLNQAIHLESLYSALLHTHFILTTMEDRNPLPKGTYLLHDCKGSLWFLSVPSKLSWNYFHQQESISDWLDVSHPVGHHRTDHMEVILPSAEARK